jgi:SAM-dependent methyltransferase
MLQRLIMLLLLLPLPIVPVAAEEEGQETRHHGFADAEHWAKVFDDPARRNWQMPLQVVELLSVRPGQKVADLGAGTGFFLPTLCTAVGERGRVYAVEIEPTLIDHIKQREDLRPYRDVVVPVLARPDDPVLPQGELDLVLVVNTWHHIDGRVDYLQRLHRSLRRGGRIAIIDWREGELPVGPPPEERLSRESVIAEFEQAGWIFDSESVLLPYQYFLVFEQPR